MKDTLTEERFRLAWLLLLLAAGCAGTVSSDPNEGGLLGGIHGLSSGKYEERVKEREQGLQHLQEIQRNLDDERSTFETEKGEKAAGIEAKQRNLDLLLSKTNQLAGETAKLESALAGEKEQQQELQKKLPLLQAKIRAFAEKDTQGLTVKQLEEERAALEKEYRLLLELYRQLSQ